MPRRISAKDTVARAQGRSLEKIIARDGGVVKRVVAANGDVLVSSHVGSTRLKKAGGSLVAVVPAAARAMLNLSEGQQLAVTVEGTKITLEPIIERHAQRVVRPRYSLDELLEQGNSTGLSDGESETWRNSPKAGREVW